ncbi:MAG: peroxide stress protein YaaA, partial [Rubrivivax sp.]
MLFLVSPAKTLDYDSPVPPAVARKATEPAFTGQAAELIGVLKRQSPRQVAALMDLSEGLAALNAARYAAWRPEATPANSRPAVLA